MVYPLFNQTEYIYPVNMKNYLTLSHDFEKRMLENYLIQMEKPFVQIVNKLMDKAVNGIELIKCQIACPIHTSCFDLDGNGIFLLYQKDSHIKINIESNIIYDKENSSFISYIPF